jgi:lysophospholipase L1-like esterase
MVGMRTSTSHPRAKFLLGASVAIAAGVPAWRYARVRTAAHDTVTIVDRTAETRDLLSARAERAADLEAPAPGRVRPLIPVEDARVLFPLGDEHLVYDPYTYFRYRGGIDDEALLPEHPAGRYRRKTSRDGFREDFERLPEERDFLAVITGDSQTDGLCSNAESFCNRAEANLAARYPGKVIEVLNAGVASFSFYNYLGTLEKLLDAKPDVFVVAFYSGNDFKDMVVPCHYAQRTRAPAARPEYVQQLKAAMRLGHAVTVMALNPILYFKYEPAEARMAFAASLEACTEIVRLCRAHDIDLVVVHIPAAFRTGGALPAACAAAQRELALDDDEMRVNDRMADELIADLRKQNVDVVDLRRELPADIETYYYSDMHLNVKGHAFVGELLAPKLATLYAARANRREHPAER